MDIKSSLRNRVCGIYSDKDGFCGTGFNFNYKQCVLTAKHNVVNKEKVFVVYVLNKRPKRFSISHIHHHPSLDLSAIILKDENLEDVEVFVDDPSFSTPPIGLEVISYRFLQLQNEMSQPLKGKVIRIYGSTTDYTFELSFSPIKGNSGAPVLLSSNINKVIGMLYGYTVGRDESNGSPIKYGVAIPIPSVMEWVETVLLSDDPKKREGT